MEKICFAVMQIGNSELDKIWSEIYSPTILECGLKPTRVDQDDDGRLLKPQIIEFLNDADLIIGDLTNSRPNCYLEIGYAMGLGRHRQIILCCKENHNADSPNYRAGEQKVHFDLQGYGITWWDSAKLSDFQKQLKEKIQRRLSELPVSPKTVVEIDRGGQTSNVEESNWVKKIRNEVFSSLEKLP